MLTNGISKIEMETMNAILSLAHSLEKLSEEAEKQTSLLEEQNQMLDRINDTIKWHN